jgi:predicted  nucleic acid-binding Zn-ribbon protein
MLEFMILILSSDSGENEVSVEWFLKLREIDSLGKMRINHLKLLDEQQGRVEKLLERKEMTILQTTSLSQELRSLQQNMFELEKKLKLSSEQKDRLHSLGGDENKIRSLEKEIEHLEIEGFELLDRQENIQKEISENKTFLQGLEKTIAEIELEVSEDKMVQEKELSQITMRLKLLEEELPSDFQKIYQRVLQRKLAHGPFTKVDSGNCFFCRYKISRQDESEIDLQQQLKACHQCGRIFLPHGSY